MTSTPTSPPTSTDERLSTFEKGGSIEVPPARIEAELSVLWREAAQAHHEAVTRACLWNFIVRCDGDTDFKYAKQLIDDVSQRLATRAIVLRPQISDEEGEIKAWIEANWRRDGHHASGSDEVTLLASGGAVSRLESMVRALTITDAPTAMMWLGPPPSASEDKKEPGRELIKEIDRLLVDTRKLPSEAGLAQLAHLAEAQPELEVVDLSWMGLSPLRGLCAALFDPPHDPSPLWQLDRVRVSSGVKGTQARALLILGWLGSRLGWRDYRRVDAGWQATRRAGGTVEIALSHDPAAADHGVASLELESRGERWSLKRDQTCIDVRGPGLPERIQPARSHTDAELTVSALGPRGRDTVYPGALQHAGLLVRS